MTIINDNKIQMFTTYFLIYDEAGSNLVINYEGKLVFI